MRKNINQSSRQGFTLIELLIVIVLMSLLAGGFLTLQFILSQNQIAVWTNYISVNDANNSVTQLVRELRTARDGDNGAYAIETADDSEIIFYSDYDFDGQVERLRYALAGTELTKGVIEPEGSPSTYPPGQEKVKVLSDNIRNAATPIFYYYNSDWPEDTVNNPLTTPASPADIKLVRIYLKLNNSANQPDKDYELESFSQIRMLKENL